MFRSINGGILPQRATKYSAGFDVFANEDVIIGAGETKIVSLGVAIDHEYTAFSHTFKATSFLELHPRSSLRASGLGGGVGVIDIDYQEEIKMVLTNPVNAALVTYMIGRAHGWDMPDFPLPQDVQRIIKKGDKIGQLILKHHGAGLLPQEYTLDVERTGGFGSTN